MSAAQYAREALERAEKATEGRWEFVTGKGGDRSWAAGPIDHLGSDDYGYVTAGLTREDSRFIAWARDDVPKLARAVLAVIDMHKPHEVAYMLVPGDDAHHEQVFECRVCGEWPCPTVRVLSDALEVEA